MGINDDVEGVVRTLTVSMSSLDCPHCFAAQDGWLCDPRGETHKCDECGKSYYVPPDVRLVF